MLTPVRIAVLVSGGGTNLQALIDAQNSGALHSGRLETKVNAAALDHIREHVACADRGKLVGVADEDEIGLGLERVEQRGEQ